MAGHALTARLCLDSDCVQGACACLDEEGDCIWAYFSCPFCFESGELLVGSSGSWPIVVCERMLQEFAVHFDPPELLSEQ
jgi:hypothetical protein